jgi:hypothetical protein
MHIAANPRPRNRRGAITLGRAGARRAGRICAAVALLIGPLANAAPSDDAPGPSEPAAPSPETKKKAMEHFETGLKLYEDGDFSLALIEFERAYSDIPDFRVLYNIGQVSIQLGRYARAAQALQQYLQAGGPNVAAARTKSVREDLQMLEGRTAHLQVDSNVEDAEILLDDVRLAKTPIVEPILVDAGEHRLTVLKPGYVTRTERLVLAGRDESRLRIDLTQVQQVAPIPLPPIATPVQPPPKQAETPEPAGPPSRRTQLLYVGAGATGLLAIAWAVTGYVGIKAASDLHSALQGPTNHDQVDPLRAKARGWLLASDILGGAALATGATTLYFTLKGPSNPPTRVGLTRIDLGLGPGAVQLNGSFR